MDPEALRRRECYAGLDLSTTTDIAALVLLFPPVDGDNQFHALPFFWVPEETVAKRSRRDQVPYDAWVRDGFIEATEGNVADYDVIRKWINELAARHDLREVAVDRWNASQITSQLVSDGITIVPFGQGFRDMSGPTKELEKLLLSKRLRHAGNPVLRWMADNVSVRQDPAGNLKPDKAKSTGRIDGIVALIMALGRAIVQCGAGEVRIWGLEG